MKIELTEQESQFIIDVVGRVQIPATHPNGDAVWQVANSILKKLRQDEVDSDNDTTD